MPPRLKYMCLLCVLSNLNSNGALVPRIHAQKDDHGNRLGMYPPQSIDTYAIYAILYPSKCFQLSILHHFFQVSEQGNRAAMGHCRWLRRKDLTYWSPCPNGESPTSRRRAGTQMRQNCGTKWGKATKNFLTQISLLHSFCQ